jgi:2-succinyl-6-hydroxy-2,4-cyclohexadiene-1-carboxylate synthase
VPESLVLLHGFGGTRHTWDGVVAALPAQRYRPLALDLPGHGEAAAEARRPITFDSCVAHVLARAPERSALCGYSLGGRVALHVALAAPERVSRLVLVSTSAGIEDDAERAARRAADGKLADELESTPFESFLDRWNAQPLFADDPAPVSELALEDQRRNEPISLASAMRGLGTGEMSPLWMRLGELTMPVTILAGERDLKFRKLTQRMAGCLADEGEVKLLNGGHRLPLENPRGLAHALEAPEDLDFPHDV